MISNIIACGIRLEAWNNRSRSSLKEDINSKKRQLQDVYSNNGVGSWKKIQFIESQLDVLLET